MVISLGDRPIVLRTQAAGMRDLGGGQWIGPVAIGGDNKANKLLYG